MPSTIFRKGLNLKHDVIRGRADRRDGFLSTFAEIDDHYRAFETTGSATQDRQYAVTQLLDERPFDLAIVIGGYNSSNTRNLARLCTERVATYHIASPSCLISPTELTHRPSTTPVASHGDNEITSHGWLPATGPITVAVTAGASPPDNIVGEVIEKLATFANPR